MCLDRGGCGTNSLATRLSTRRLRRRERAPSLLPGAAQRYRLGVAFSFWHGSRNSEDGMRQRAALID